MESQEHDKNTEPNPLKTSGLPEDSETVEAKSTVRKPRSGWRSWVGKARLAVKQSSLMRGWHRITMAVANVWRVFASSKAGKAIIAVASVLRMLWRKRMRFSYACYVAVFVLIDAAAVLFTQWGMYSEPTYDDPNMVDQTTKLMNSVPGQLTKFVSQMWMEQKYNALLNLVALGMIYLVLVFLLNRFWVATALFSIVMSSFAVANHIKVQLRSEPVLPSDLSFLTAGNGGQIASYIPEGSRALVNGTVTMLIWLTVICLALQLLDGRKCVIPFHWRKPFRNAKVIAGNVSRVVALAVSVAVLWSFTWNLNVPGTWSNTWAARMGDSPIPWSTVADAASNGPSVNFLRLAHAKTMEKPEGYGKEAMESLAAKYRKNAEQTNQSRANNLTDSTVIMILSESFSDPTRVSGVAFTEDPMPNIRALKDVTTSGLMLSPGIGGGTANIEYQALTGLDLALFDDSLQSPYQELVPHQKQPYAFNQLWNEAYGEDGSVAIHPYYKNMYLRDSNYKRFGFGHFYSLDSAPAVAHQDRVDNSPFVSDVAAYQNVIDQLSATESHPQFIQLVTIQNHASYEDWYVDNQFKEADVSSLSDGEKQQIDVYAKGVNLTDQATVDFLNQLNAIDRPITVIFYGDHLPGIYFTASEDENNTTALHETDYFIWSNQASPSAGAKLDGQQANYTSSNYFMPLAAEHMNAKVSPYLEMLTEMQSSVPAFSRLIAANSSWGTDSGTLMLDANGNALKTKDLSAQAKQLVEDYRMIQYDMTKGKGYLSGTDFFTVN